LGTGTDYSPDRVAIEVQAFFPNRTQWSRGIAVKATSEHWQLHTELEVGFEWPDKAITHLMHGLGNETPIAVLAGVIVDEFDPFGRPCLTLMVSGPGGAEEAAMIIADALADKGLNSGVCIRTVRSGSSGVVKLVFSPELILASGTTKGYGVDWDIWKAFAQGNPELEWNRACLMWCDQVAAAVGGLLKDVPLMVDQVFFDYMRAAVLFPGDSLKAALEDPDVLIDMVNSYPYECMFGQIED